jgi:tRNA(fMet)-specific endonuclease VapC
VRYLLDTDTCSYLIDGRFPEVRQRALALPISEIGISVITRAELRFGVELKRSGKLDRLVSGFLAEFKCLPWTPSCADIHASIRAKLQKSGLPIGGFDTMIAAHAIALDVTLISHNLKHFGKVPGLQLEDWVNPQ